MVRGTAIAAATASVANPGVHGFSEILYAFSSAGNNNGSAFAGLAANTPFYNTALGLAMLFGVVPYLVVQLTVLLVAGGALHWPVGWWTYLQMLAFGFSSVAIWFIDHVVDADGSGT